MPGHARVTVSWVLLEAIFYSFIFSENFEHRGPYGLDTIGLFSVWTYFGVLFANASPSLRVFPYSLPTATFIENLH